jgi:TATA-box binding protein (TBP) (component of TFIID and TFIIIB)
LKAPPPTRRFINIENVVATATLHQNIDKAVTLLLCQNSHIDADTELC